jgi:hypothetical protein
MEVSFSAEERVKTPSKKVVCQGSFSDFKSIEKWKASRKENEAMLATSLPRKSPNGGVLILCKRGG